MVLKRLILTVQLGPILTLTNMSSWKRIFIDIHICCSIMVPKLTSEALLSNFASLRKILLSLSWLLTDMAFFLGPDVFYSTGIMKVECICKQNHASSVCVVTLGQGHRLIENYHRRSSPNLLSRTEWWAVEIWSAEACLVRYKLNPSGWF